MTIDKKLIHFKTKENFMSANGVNGNPNTPTSGSEETGNAEYGQIKGTSIVFIKDSQEIWTHGQLYSCSDPDLSNFVTKEELEELEKLSAPMISVTYNELKTLRDNSQLIPGQQYRITDYVTTTSQENTQSAGHPFDVIITADNENTLNEEARACIHEGDTYFTEAGANLAAWQIWYSLDNDSERFAWADTDGKGVIYRMIDEWNNDCPYDFKNIQFKRNLSFDEGFAQFSDDGEETWVYTFAGQSYHLDNDEFSGMLDGSLESPFGHMSDENTSTFHSNIIKPYIKFYDDINEDRTKSGIRYLNNNVFLGYWGKIGSYDGDAQYVAYCCYSNSFGNNCHSNSFGNCCSYNSFGDNCNYNSFGDNCNYNSFGDNCNYNSFGNVCNYNSFGVECYENSFGNCCSYNSFGNVCNYNSFGVECYENSFGANCNYNSFAAGCASNSFAAGCSSNSFGTNCYENSFDTNCDSNSFGEYCQRNSFGDSCNNNSFSSGCNDNVFSDGCNYNSLGNGCCSNILCNGCMYNTFGSHCFFNSFGKYCNYNWFGNDCLSNSFLTEASKTAYLKNYCYHNHFDDGCSYNLIWNSDTTSNSVSLKNINVNRGVSGTLSSFNIINVTTLNQDYEIQVAKNSKGEIKIYCEADLIA